MSKRELLDRMDPKKTMILTCGNPTGMADIQHIAEVVGAGFDMETW